MENKTNVIRLLESSKVKYQYHEYDGDSSMTGVDVANQLNEDPERVFKTLVTVSKSKQHYVFVIPVEQELDLKKAAKAVGEKYIEMVKSKELLPLTGYVHGGCSPIGMKKFFPTFIDETACLFDEIIFSGGKIGLQVEMSLDELKKIIEFDLVDLCTYKE